jgi:SAM-dependent methyltransferase
VTAPSTAQIAARWSANADRYHRWGDLAHGHPDYQRAWVDAVAHLVGHPRRDGSPRLRVADIGTGTGEIALLLAGMGHDVTGYDIAPGRVFWAIQDKLEVRSRLQHRTSDTRTSHYRSDAGQPPGMRWQSVADAQRHFTEAGLSDTTQSWLDTVFDVDRRTAPLRWRIAGRLPRFFTVTCQLR